MKSQDDIVWNAITVELIELFFNESLNRGWATNDVSKMKLNIGIKEVLNRYAMVLSNLLFAEAKKKLSETGRSNANVGKASLSRSKKGRKIV